MADRSAHGVKPPEQRRWLYPQYTPGNLPRVKIAEELSSKTNIYAVGQLMYQVINEQVEDFVPNRPDHIHENLHSRGRSEVRGVLFERDDPGHEYYLKDLVEQCLEYHPNDRPTLLTLRDEIRHYIQAHNLEPRSWNPPADYYGDMGFFEHRLYWRAPHLWTAPWKYAPNWQQQPHVFQGLP